jgi:hypothetical protein
VVAKRRCFLDACAGWSADMKPDLARIDGREKVLPNPRQKSERNGAGNQKTKAEEGPMLDTSLE